MSKPLQQATEAEYVNADNEVVTHEYTISDINVERITNNNEDSEEE